MSTITFDDRTFTFADGETVLDALQLAGVPVPSSCRAGACQSCLMRATAGVPPTSSQAGLKDSLKAQGYFLSCVCRPTEPLTVALPDSAAVSTRASVLKVSQLSGNVARLLLACHAPFDYRAGQYVNLVRPDGLSRSYSIASLPGRDPHLELHVRKVAGGQMSSWICDELQGGEELDLRGPAGDCFYTPGRPDQPLLLAGTGTGLAPLFGIVQDALRQGHAGPIYLYHGAVSQNGLYLVEELEALAASHPHLAYTRCLLSGEPAEGIQIGPIDQVVAEAHKSLKGFRVYLCGDPAIVQKMKKRLFLAGAKMNEIHADAFLPTAMPMVR